MKFVIPDVVASQFHLNEGDTVADFGAGSGFFMAPLSKLVGPEGRVYALEIQKTLVEKIGDLVQTQGLLNVDTVWCDLEAAGGTKLATGVLDCAIIVNTFYQIEDKSTMLGEVSRTLRPGGKLMIVDWTETVPGLGPAPDRVIPADNCIAEVETAGLTFERQFAAGEHHYGLAFRKN